MHWFHPKCAAYKRPEPMLEALQSAHEVPGREELERLAREGIAQERLRRIDGAERAPSSQARCRHCREPIEKGAWRIRLVFHEEGTFSPGGFIHVGCRQAYFGADGLHAQVLHFSAALDPDEQSALSAEFDINER
jgi:hypothetical protein